MGEDAYICVNIFSTTYSMHIHIQSELIDRYILYMLDVSTTHIVSEEKMFKITVTVIMKEGKG